MKKAVKNTIAISLACASALAFAKPKKTAALDPVKAVTELAPVERKASLPKEGVFYQIFLRSFADSNGDGIGDLKGLIAKLDYLNDGNDLTTEDLGITGIWLCPIFPSPSYHGYDVDDYYSINPDFGTIEDFELLCSECAKRGIAVIIDITCNHSSTYNEWFKASRDKDDPHRSWYHWITPEDEGYNLNAQMWGHNLWNEDFKNKGEYYAGLFGRHMPDFNLDNPELREEFKKISKFWFDKGVSGFRYDAAGHVYDSCKKKPGFNESTKYAVEWWNEIISYNYSVKPDQYSVGEVWDNTSIRAQYIKGIQSNFHFNMDQYIVEQLRAEDAGKNTFANMMESDLEQYAKQNPDYIDAPFLTNHDQPRIGGLLKGDTGRLKSAAATYLLCEGVPFMYYGEEIAMMSGTKDETKRTPMLWDVSKNDKPKDKMQTTWAAAGDCVYNRNTKSVKEQEKDPASLLNYYKRLIRLRTAHPALYAGKFHAVDTGTSSVVSWAMTADKENAFVLNNVTSAECTVEVPEEYAGMNVIFVSEGSVEKAKGGAGNCSKITVPPYGTVVLAK